MINVLIAAHLLIPLLGFYLLAIRQERLRQQRLLGSALKALSIVAVTRGKGGKH